MTFAKANQTDLKATHQANLLALLNHRLEVAREHQDQQLVAALEREYEQLNSFTQPTLVSGWLQRQWVNFAETLSDWTKVHIEQLVDEQGQTYWYAYNPQAGRAICTDSKAEMHQWIKKTYWEK
jgi:hypothetical protein